MSISACDRAFEGVSTCLENTALKYRRIYLQAEKKKYAGTCPDERVNMFA